MLKTKLLPRKELQGFKVGLQCFKYNSFKKATERLYEPG
jgi:hypothetical protein